MESYKAILDGYGGDPFAACTSRGQAVALALDIASLAAEEDIGGPYFDREEWPEALRLAAAEHSRRVGGLRNVAAYAACLWPVRC